MNTENLGKDVPDESRYNLLMSRIDERIDNRVMAKVKERFDTVRNWMIGLLTALAVLGAATGSYLLENIVEDSVNTR